MWMTGKLNLPEGKLFSEELSTFIGTQSDLIKSGVVQMRAYDRIRARFPEIASAETNETAAATAIPFTLAVKSSMKSSVLELTATGPSPEATRAYVNAVMDEYLAFKKDARKQTSFGALSTITDQVREAEKQVREIQARMIAFETTNNMAYVTERSSSAGKHLSDIGALLSDLRTESHLLEMLSPDQVKDIAQRGPGVSAKAPLPGEKAAQALLQNSAVTQPGYYQAMQQLQLLKARRDDFAQSLRPTHSKMIKLNQEISGLEKLLDLLRQEGQQQAIAQITSRKQSIDLQIQNLEGQYRAWDTNAVEASSRVAEHNRFKQDLDRSQALYDRLLSLVQTVDLNKSLDQEPSRSHPHPWLPRPAAATKSPLRACSSPSCSAAASFCSSR